MKKKARFTHYGKSYNFIGAVPKKNVEIVRIFLQRLCDGMPGVGGFGTSGSHNVGGGHLGFDLSLCKLRMDHNKKAQDLIREAANVCRIPWLEKVLLKTEPEYNQFIFSTDGELWAIVW